MEKTRQDIEQAHPHILIVDDQVDVCCMMANFLKKSGFKVSLACTVAEAYDMMEQEPFTTIISNVKMPGEDGISLLVRVRKTCPDTPVILMAGAADLQMAIAAINHGAFDFIQKPFDYTHMTKVVERAVNYTRLRHLESNFLVEVEQSVSQRTRGLKSANDQKS